MMKHEHIPIFTRVLAFFCIICPFRRAYNKVKHVQIKAEESAMERQIPVSHIKNVA